MRKINFILLCSSLLTTSSFGINIVELSKNIAQSKEIVATTTTTIPPIPVATAATEITSSSFTANWTPITTGIDGYYIDFYDYITNTNITQNGVVTMLNETFSKFTAGSIATPDGTNLGGVAQTGGAGSDLLIDSIYINTTAYNKNTAYANDGWYGASVYQAGGNMYLPIYGQVFTPSINLSTGVGHFTVNITVSSASQGTALMIAHTPDGYGRTWESDITASNFHLQDLNGDGVLDGYYGESNVTTQTYSYNFYQGDVNSSIFIFVQQGSLTISDIQIVQTLDVGDKMKEYLVTDTITNPSNSNTLVNGTQANVQYSYALRTYSGTNYSNESNLIYVTQTLGVDPITENLFNVFTNNQTINVNLVEDNVIYIYNTSGQLINITKGVKGLNEIYLNAKGVFYVKVKNNSVPVIL
jgi:hypothetical protein